MKPSSGKGASSPKRFRFRLEYVAGFFITAAVLFTVYCGVQVAFPGVGSSQGGSKPAAQTTVKRGLNEDDLDSDALDLDDGRISSSTSGGSHLHRHVRAGSDVAAAPPCPTAQTITKEVTVEKPVTKFVYGLSAHNPRAYHVVTTTQGFANHWQARIHYFWYKRQREICQQTPPCDMGGFTRLLHSGVADDLMDEIPTVVVDHLPDEILKDSSYVVLNRPYAFLMWLKRVSIPEKYFLMCESDHLFLRPMPNMMNGESSGAALFTYIVPTNYPTIVRKFIGNVSDDEVKKVPQIGNSPTMLSVEEFRVLAPIWYNTTMDIFNDKEAHEAWNWVLEMYGYTLATYRANQHVNMKVHPSMLAHPPFDKTELDEQGRPFYILHLTYPCRYDKAGNMTDKPELTAWQFDKRSYGQSPPPRNLEAPPPNVQNQLVRNIIAMINEATDSIPCWDDYVATSKVTSKCGSLHGGALAAGVANAATTTARTR